MLVRDVMTSDPVWCVPETDLQRVSRLMADHDCGEIPICDSKGHLIGVVTDRDIVCRVVAMGENPLDHTAADCMSQPVIAASPEMQLRKAATLMEQHQIRRLPVLDENRVCCGMLAQADLATNAPAKLAGEVVERISQPAMEA
jgi:CBS domain-containing protein